MSKKKSPQPEQVYIEYMPLLGMALAPRNPKRHEVEEIKASFRRFGFVQVPAINETTGRLCAGHGRREALIEMKEAGEPAPARIQVRDGEWFVPVLRGVAFATDEEAEAYLLADNRLTEIGGWDEELLAKIVSDLAKLPDGLGLQGVGYDDKEIERMVASTQSQSGGNCDPDDVPEPPAEPISKRGDLWLLGDHRLLCGDSTSAEDVSRLMGGERAGLMNTDPPYGVDYAAIKNGIPRSGFRDIQARGGDIANDNLTSGPELQAFLEKVIRAAVPHLTETPAFYLWHPMLTQGTFFAAAAAAADILIHRQIIWVKPHMVLTRSGQYHWQHELCFYGWIRGKPCPWHGEKNQVSVWHIGREGDGNARENHPTQKPVELFAIPMRNHTRSGDVAYEPFSGSGSQIIAAEQLSRRCYAMELEPRYVDVAVARWEKFTGKQAIKVDSGDDQREPCGDSAIQEESETPMETPHV